MEWPARCQGSRLWMVIICKHEIRLWTCSYVQLVHDIVFVVRSEYSIKFNISVRIAGWLAVEQSCVIIMIIAKQQNEILYLWVVWMQQYRLAALLDTDVWCWPPAEHNVSHVYVINSLSPVKTMRLANHDEHIWITTFLLSGALLPP